VQQKCCKAVGPDCVDMDAYKNSGHRLVVYLKLLFNLYLCYSYLPRLRDTVDVHQSGFKLESMVKPGVMVILRCFTDAKIL